MTMMSLMVVARQIMLSTLLPIFPLMAVLQVVVMVLMPMVLLISVMVVSILVV